MSRFLWCLMIALLGGIVPVQAGPFSISASERGFVSVVGVSNGASPTNGYFAGRNTLPDLFRNWFEFPIPTLTGGSLTSAVLNLDDPQHFGGVLTYAVYGLVEQPLVFTDVTSSDAFGSISTSGATTVSLTLNAAALAAIAAHQGGNIFVGGIDSGETSSSLAYDFGSTGSGDTTALVLTTAPSDVPEPTSLALVGTVIAILPGLRRWQRSRTRPS